MRKIFVILLFICQLAHGQEQKITTFILVRHAEKAENGKDPELSEQGVQRAERLSAMLKNANITAVYSTKYKRTRNTVGGIARVKNLPVTDYESLTVEALKKISIENAGGTVLIAGHSNTVPQIANLLLGQTKFENFPDSEYGTILVISALDVGETANVLTLHY